MGFFDKPTLTCGVCQREIGPRDKRWKTADNQYVCAECQKPFGILNGRRAFSDMTCEDIRVRGEQIALAKEHKENVQHELAAFKYSASIDGRLHIDKENKRWYIGGFDDANKIYPIEDIEQISISIGGKVANTTTVSSKKGTIPRAVVGGILAGRTGAVIGAMTAKSHASSQTSECQTATVYIKLKGNSTPLFITFLNSDMAHQAHDFLIEAIGAEIESKLPVEASSADELRKFKSLLDDGIITQEEFDVKKKQLLGL